MTCAAWLLRQRGSQASRELFKRKVTLDLERVCLPMTFLRPNDLSPPASDTDHSPGLDIVVSGDLTKTLQSPILGGPVGGSAQSGKTRMEDRDLELKLYELLASCLPNGKARNQIRPEMTLRRDLGLDSVQLLMLLFKFEQEFGVEMPNSALSKGAMASVGELIQTGMDAVRNQA
jgi:acyl carrier protein